MSTQFVPSIRKLSRGRWVFPLLVALLVGAVPAAPAAPSGPYLVKDINPGSADSLVQWKAYPVGMDGWLYFAADDGTHGLELWKSDGTLSGTVLVKDIKPGPGGSDLCGFTEMNGRLFFGADDGIHGKELWKSDGTTSGTVIVKDINPGSASAGGGCGGTSVNGTLYFSANDGIHGHELWKSDGTAANTALVKDICPGSGSPRLRTLAEFDDILFFGADDPCDDLRNFLWRSTGTEGSTVLLRDSTGNRFSDVMSFLATNDWLLMKIEYGTIASGECDADLWRTDGTEGGTTLVKELVHGTHSDPCMEQLTDVGGKVFFVTYQDDNFIDDPRLWSTDGTGEGTMPIRMFYADDDGLPQLLAGVSDMLLFSANDGSRGMELWKSDGRTIGTVEVKDIFPGSGGSWPQGGAVIGRNLFFAADDGVLGRELWQSYGTEVGTRLVWDINPGEGDAFQEPEDHATTMHSVGTTLFFWANEGIHGYELWALDTGACSAPAKPILVEPTDHSSTCDATPEFEWEPASGAKEYQIRIANGDDSSVVIQTETSATSFSPSTPLSPGTYFWRVRASNDCDWSPWSEKWWFTIQPPPPVPLLSSPVDGSSTYETRPIFEWTATQGANQYRLQVDNDTSFASPVIDKARSGTSYRPDAPLSPGAYHWRVRGNYDCGNGGWSEPYSLTILPVGLGYEAYLPLLTQSSW